MKPHFVYVIKSGGGPHKIGISRNPKSRLASLSAQQPWPLALVRIWQMDSRREAREIERQVHRILKGVRLHGEWFKVNARDACQAVQATVVAAAAIKKAEWERSTPIPPPEPPVIEPFEVRWPKILAEMGISREEGDRQLAEAVARLEATGSLLTPDIATEYGVSRNALYKRVHKMKGMKDAARP